MIQENDPAVTVIAFAGRDPISRGIAAGLGADHASARIHRFPDGESCVRIDRENIRERVIVVCSLCRPDPIVVPLLFLAGTLRDYGAGELVLVAPYLAYMRQDRRFHDGEGISARYFAGLLSDHFDALVTVDPHLHRIHALDEIYSVPAVVVHAAPALAQWIRTEVRQPLLIGPDEESRQWVRDVAERAGAPFIVLEKTRKGDRDVAVSVPDVARWRTHTPVLLDDIISTGKTMTVTIGGIREAGLNPPVCIGVHAIFADNAYAELLAAGAGRVVTTNTIPHESNAVDLGPELVAAIRSLAGAGG